MLPGSRLAGLIMLFSPHVILIMSPTTAALVAISWLWKWGKGKSRAHSVYKNMPLKFHTSHRIPFHCPTRGHMASHMRMLGKIISSWRPSSLIKFIKRKKESMANSNRRLFSTSATGDKWEEADVFQFTSSVCVF